MSVQHIEITSDGRYPKLLEHKATDLFHSPSWARVLADTYGLSVRAAMDFDAQGEPRSALLYCHITDAMGDRIVSLPFSDFCDPLVDSTEQFKDLLASLKLLEVPVTIRCLHNPFPPRDQDLQTIKQARWHGIDLRADCEALFNRLAQAKRRAINRARREGVELGRVSDREFLDAFHRMHVVTRKYKYRMLAQPIRFFEAICHRFGGTGDWFPLAASHNGKMIAAMIFLRWHDTLYYKFGASRAEALSLRPNEFLLWQAIELAHSLGCHRLDLGLSDIDQLGLIRFKRQMGAEEKGIRFLRYTPTSSVDHSASPLHSTLSDLTRLCTDPSVPDEITAQAGGLIYPLFA